MRLLDAEWQQPDTVESNARYTAEIKIFGHNRTGLLVDVVKILTEKKIDVASVNTRTNKQGCHDFPFLRGAGKEELNQLIEKIRQVESVVDIERTTG